MLHIGTAGWTIPTHHAESAPSQGTHLERYARTLNCAEINTSFYRSHRLATWQRWADSTPEDFRFSVKLPKAVTHIAKLEVEPGALDAFFLEIAELGSRLGPVLVQLPPSLRFEDCPAAEFFEILRDRFDGPIALEPRHATWFERDADDLLQRNRISRVAADPSRAPNTTAVPRPGGSPELAYFRLHGSPRTYYSSYEAPYLAALAKVIADLPAAIETWVIFDNTSAGHALRNALDLRALLAPQTSQAKAKGRSRSFARDGSTRQSAKSRNSTRTRSSSSNAG